MSYNKYGEYILFQDLTKSKPYCITRDKAGYHVLREGGPDGKELFSPIGDDGKKAKKRSRVYDVNLLRALMV